MKTYQKYLSRLSILTALVSYLYLIINTIAGSGENISISTYGLWAILSWIVGFAVFRKGGDYRTVMVYGIGSTTITTTLILKGRLITWTGMDTFVAIMVILCLVAWKHSGEIPALIIAVIAGTIAAIPFIGLCWEFPLESPIVPNVGFLIANATGLIGAKSWRLEDSLYFLVNTVMCILLVAPWVIARMM